VYRTMPCILSHSQTSSHHHSRCCSRYTGYQYSTIATGLQHRTNHIQKVTSTLMPAYLNELLAPCHLLDRLHECLLAHCLPFRTSSAISPYDPSVVQCQVLMLSMMLVSRLCGTAAHSSISAVPSSCKLAVCTGRAETAACSRSQACSIGLMSGERAGQSMQSMISA